MCEKDRERKKEGKKEKRMNRLLHVTEKILKDYENSREWSLFFREASVDVTLFWLLKIKAEPVKLGSTSQCNLSDAILFLSSEPFSSSNLTLKHHPQ